jgi:hypothetical protein
LILIRPVVGVAALRRRGQARKRETDRDILLRFATRAIKIATAARRYAQRCSDKPFITSAHG